MCLSLCFSSERKYGIQVTWEAKLFALVALMELVLIIAINSLLLQETMKQNSRNHDEDSREALFYEVGLYFVATLFFYQAFRAINKESKVDLGIAVALALFTALWLTNHLVNRNWYSYTSSFFDGIGVFLTFAAWFCFLLLAVLGYLAHKRFGYRAWNKVGGLSGSQNVYEATTNFRSVLRLDIFTVSFCCYTGWFYVYESPGLAACILFFLWTLAKDLTMFFSIKNGFTTHTRILRYTSIDIFIALIATLVYDFKWNGTSHVKYIIVTYIAVGTAVVATRIVLCVLTNRALDEVAQNKERAENLLSRL